MKLAVRNRLKIQKIDSWATATLEDKAGELAEKLHALALSGINLEFAIARREPGMPGLGTVSVCPIGESELAAAQQSEFQKNASPHSLRIEGPDRPGQAAEIAQALADKGINLRSFYAAAINKKFVAHIQLDTSSDADMAVQALKAL